uniref:CSON003741 protein n=1 Tax=Culicoides sonorensis TaxID=179676 RepID=A0A336L296_CULSO
MIKLILLSFLLCEIINGQQEINIPVSIVWEKNHLKIEVHHISHIIDKTEIVEQKKMQKRAKQSTRNQPLPEKANKAKKQPNSKKKNYNDKEQAFRRHMKNHPLLLTGDNDIPVLQFW